MTAQDIVALAGTFGAAGRTWHEFCTDDAVQDFVTEHLDASDTFAEWEAAWGKGWAAHVAAIGWISQWTTAPTEYDCMGTVTAQLCDWHGKPLRRILSHPHHAGFQAGRNSSANYPTWETDPRVAEREATERREQLDGYQSTSGRCAAARQLDAETTRAK